MKEKFNKNNGTISIPVTKDNFGFVKDKEEKIKNKSLEAIQRLKKTQANQINKKENETINILIEKYKHGLINDVLLKHFIEEKIRLSEAYELKQNQVKTLQIELLENINEVTNDVVKLKNNLDFIDKSILNHINN